MSKIRKALFYIFHPKETVKRKKIIKLDKEKQSLDDETFLKRAFKIRVGYDLNLNDPKSFNEKLQWLKIHFRNPYMTTLVDKYLVRFEIEKLIGGEYLIPLLGVWDSPRDIDFRKLPQQFVLKCNHNSGKGMIVCKDKNTLNISKSIVELEEGLKQDYFDFGREWPYKNVKKKIICEKYLGSGENGNGINDFKFYCFDGQPVFFLVSSDRFKKVKFDYFNATTLEKLPFTQGGPSGSFNPKTITNYKKMFEIAKVLSSGFPHVRVDLYNVEGKIYFGEMTFFDGSGFSPFNPKKWDYIIGEHLKLPK